MTTISQIISRVQSSIGDLAMERIQLGEWIDFANDVARKIAEQTEIWINRQVTIPNAGSATPVYWVALNAATNTIFPFKILRVVRATNIDPNNSSLITAGGWAECTEHPQSAVASTITGIYSYPINNTRLGANSFLTMQAHPQTGVVDGSIYLVFGGQFENNQQCVIDFISNKPWSGTNLLTSWSPLDNNPQVIPDFLSETFELGLTTKAVFSLYMRGDESFMNRWQMVSPLYDRSLRDAVGYAKNFKDNRSVLTLQPMNWLPAMDE